MKQHKLWYFYTRANHTGPKVFFGTWFGKNPDRCKMHKQLRYALSRFDSQISSIGYADSADGIDFTADKHVVPDLPKNLKLKW